MYNPVKNAKSWRKLNPREKFVALRDFIYMWGKAMGMEVYTKRPNGTLVKICGTICISTFTLIFYTTWYYVVYLGEFVRVIPVYCMFGILIAVSSDQNNIIIQWKVID